ncbi:hypothetical protein [Companilactobacillus futsaii]|uniref:hypothetical protein n=1 Tax=Companilactobacillus futsaii TaxID=938155 RepID=UPI00189F24F6|nr:hypothetical protein [Companilactobacillus futsaii]
MKGLNKISTRLILMAFFVLLMNFFVPINTVKAEPAGLPLNDYMTISKKPIIITPPFGTNYFDTNSASFIDNNETLKLTKGPGESIDDTGLITKTTIENMGTYGATWSKSDKLWDLSQRQSIAAWLYFGPFNNNSLANGEGMAFVLQNDVRKNQAMGAGLQGLGVYGWDLTRTQWKTQVLFPFYKWTLNPATPDIVANLAIKNSAAIEFDTNLNKAIDTSSPTKIYGHSDTGIEISQYTSHSFDGNLGNAGKTPDQLGISDSAGLLPNSYLGILANGTTMDKTAGHIAFSLPGNANSYYNVVDFPITEFEKQKVDTTLGLFHSNAKPANLINDQDYFNHDVNWHHVTISWEPDENLLAGTLSYKYNDKDENGIPNTNKSNSSYFKLVESSVKIPMSTFDVHNGDYNVYWGFTGANSTLGQETETEDDDVYDKYVKLETLPRLP